MREEMLDLDNPNAHATTSLSLILEKKARARGTWTGRFSDPDKALGQSAAPRWFLSVSVLIK
jgi:hypothetical protein